MLAAAEIPGWLYNTLMFVKVLIGFSVIIFVHELGHFLAAKWVGIRVDRFSIGFGLRLFGFRRGEGFTLGRRPEYKPDELQEKGYGETDYCFKALPIGGYVKMLGQDDIVVDDKTGEVSLSDDPRAFTNKPVGKRMIVVSAGVIFNLLFAALLLMAVFLLGRQMPSPVIGWVHPDSPAQGKLFPGDRVVAVDGRKAKSFIDVKIRTALADDTVAFKIERNGQVLDEEIVVETKKDEEDDLPMVGVEPVLSTELIRDGYPVDDLPNAHKGDVITHIDGQPVESGHDLLAVFGQSRGRILKCTVRRPAKDDPDRFKTVECHQRAILAVSPAELEAERRTSLADSCHILGLLRRRMVGLVEPGSPAEEAGFQEGDVIAEWGTVLNPTHDEILAAIQASAGKETRVLVERQGVETELRVTPRRPFKLFGTADAKVGLELTLRGEEDQPIVAALAPDTPFAELSIPRGARLLAIDGQPVSDWFEVVEALMAAAGRTVEVGYRSGSDEVTGRVTIPSSLVNELGLSTSAVVWSVDGVRSVEVDDKSGASRMLSVGNPLALRELLASKIGQTVTVRFSPSLYEGGEPREEPFTVRPDNIDPWQMRIVYMFDRLSFASKTERVDAGGNPLRAMKMGVDITIYQIWQVYRYLTKLASRRISAGTVAGPVGIVGMAIQQAKLGLPELMFFLAFLSVNLAVLNFLPVPVLDGGLMIFLIIEKIKGKPLSLKAQMISTMVGLAAIILVGVFVTIQDITRFF
jgi:regulator of sigma E protease